LVEKTTNSNNMQQAGACGVGQL